MTEIFNLNYFSFFLKHQNFQGFLGLNAKMSLKILKMF